MKDQIISFKTAKLAKEKGFDEVCSYLYENSKDIVYTTHKNSGLNKHFDWYSVPTQSSLQKWLRDEHSINVYCVPTEVDETKWYHNIANSFRTYIGSYEEALEEGLFQALKLIKNEDS